MRRAHRLLAGVLAAGALLASGCAQSVDPIERLGRKAAQQVPSGPGVPGSAHKRWGLPSPLLAAPKPPARRPKMPYVVDRVPTREKVVFLTFDHGAERDPEFARMVGDLKLPISTFRTGDGTDLRTLSYEGQRDEICRRRERLLRPPRGAYNADTLRAAAHCGVRAVVLGRAYVEGERLLPGAIVLAHTGTTGRMLRHIQAQGYAVARLEDYV
ncbi:polysaccharide deacetylase family protein [Streptomyces sp. NPDC005283]|uniref:polysaccharide deacetylase family protein n=1 Tax=unclassified Streptomyces TaxID=2593676 RepID=UPI003451BCEB